MTSSTRKYKDTPNRLVYWNYSSPGKYYITICSDNRQNLFGRIENGIMILSEFGEIVKFELLEMSKYHKRVILDEWIIMPDHVHLLIELGDWNYDNGVSLVGDNDCGVNHVGKIHEFSLHEFSLHEFSLHEFSLREFSLHEFSLHEFSLRDDQLKQYRAMRRRMIIPKILGKFQMLTSKQINILRNTPGQTNWQHDYYDHIIRNPESYLRIKQYIIDNPEKYVK